MASSQRRNIVVGTFGQGPNGEPVPESMNGNKIWYSEKHDLFMITDINSNAKKTTFKMGKFREFVDANVIMFQSPSMEAYMMSLLEDWEAANGQDMQPNMNNAYGDQGGYGEYGWNGNQAADDDYYDDYEDDGYGYDDDGYDDYDDYADYQQPMGRNATQKGMKANIPMSGGGAPMDGMLSMEAESPYEPQQKTSRRRSNRRDDNPRNLKDDDAKAQKDPTRHMGLFMALTFIFAIIIVIVINFGQPIIQAVAPLLS